MKIYSTILKDYFSISAHIIVHPSTRLRHYHSLPNQCWEAPSQILVRNFTISMIRIIRAVVLLQDLKLPLLSLIASLQFHQHLG